MEKLIYDINAGDKLQRMNLVYKIYGETIISDQPSHPQEQKSKFKIEDNNKLILEFEGKKNGVYTGGKEGSGLVQ
jgi:hypothetical protein